jgi:hypothetical protein
MTSIDFRISVMESIEHNTSCIISAPEMIKNKTIKAIDINEQISFIHADEFSTLTILPLSTNLRITIESTANPDIEPKIITKARQYE